MDPIRNPYTTNAGAEPQVLIGRDDQLKAFDLLVKRIRRGMMGFDWVVVELEVSKHDIEQFRRELAARLRTALLQLSPRAKWNDRMRHAAGVLSGEARRAFAEPAAAEGAEFTSEALDRAVDLSGGYPYFIQELGYAVGPAITADDVDAAVAIYESKLDSSFFRVRLDRATDLQRTYLRAMAELGPEPQKAADVAALIDRTSSQVAPTRAELINMGLLSTPEHGYAAFTVPHFDQFMRRAVPELVIPERRRRGERKAR